MSNSTSKKSLKLIISALLVVLSSVNLSLAQTSQTFWWNDAVFYEVFVRSFKDSSGDGNGDLKGLIGKLDYLNDGNPSTHNDLGVTGIWVMPVMQSPSYHGYDVTDYCTIEQDYGTNQDFKDFINAAHARGIKVIVDYVMNHSSSDHPWFTESATGPTSAKRDWYRWQDTAPSGLGPWSEQLWYPLNSSNYYAVFWSGMPDLNYTTAAVKDTMFKIANFWLTDMNADGFRLDAARYVIEDGNAVSNLEDTPETIQFWKDFRASYKATNPDAFAVGEAWATTSIVQPYVGTDGLDYCFEFDLAAAIVSTANTGSTSGLKSKMDQVMTTYPFLQFGTFLTNHDMDRVMSQLGSNVSKAKLASELVLTLPGVTFLYYGEEIGMIGSGADENKRRPMQWTSNAKAGFTTGTPWESVNSDYATKNIALQQHDASSLWSNYKNLITIRNNQAALRRGDYKYITSSVSAVFPFLRNYGNENIIVVSNTSSSAASGVLLNLSSSTITQGTYTMVELQGGTQLSVVVDANGGFTNLSIGQIPGQSTLIYKLLDPAMLKAKVTFEIDMSAMIAHGDFTAATETVDMVADFNNFGADSTTQLKDPDGDGIYATTISTLNIGTKFNYKYRINAVNNGRQEFANSSYLRQYIVPEGTDTIIDVYQKQDVFTGIEDALKQHIAVYPIPSTKDLFIEFSEGFMGKMEYQISDMLGVERISSSFVSTNKIGQQDISCETLPSGVYQLTLTYKGSSQVFRIIIQK